MQDDQDHDHYDDDHDYDHDHDYDDDDWSTMMIDETSEHAVISFLSAFTNYLLHGSYSILQFGNIHQLALSNCSDDAGCYTY